MLTKQVPALEGPFRGAAASGPPYLGVEPSPLASVPPKHLPSVHGEADAPAKQWEDRPEEVDVEASPMAHSRSRLRLRRGTGRRGPRVHGSPSGGGLGRPPGPLPPPLRPHDRTPGDDARRRGRPADPRPAGGTQRRWGTRRRKAWPSEIAVPSSETTRRPNIRRPRDLPFFPLEGGRLQSVPPAVGLRMVRGPTSVKRLRLRRYDRRG